MHWQGNIQMSKHEKHNHRRVQIHNGGVVNFEQDGSVLILQY